MENQLDHMTRLLERLIEQQSCMTALLRDVVALVDGFTAGGASFTAYQVDPMALAYLSVAGPQMNRLLVDCSNDVVEILKAAGPLARRIIEEYDAYRSSRGGLDYLEEQGALIDDPWSNAQQES